MFSSTTAYPANRSGARFHRARSLAHVRLTLLAGAASLALGAAAAHAQDTATTTATTTGGDEAAVPAGDIVITGSRIVRDGYSAPTPVTVLGSQEINAQKPANISDFVNQLPAITAGSTSANSSGSLSNGNAGIASVNLRGLGAGRTLVLLDGQRSVASSVNGTVDVNTIPQDLVERVEVVTGGASAQYGSDAVGGVINFILNKKFTGLKVTADEGLSTYGDGFNYRLGATAGLSLLDDRLHILLNGSYFKQNPVTSIKRSWNDSAYFQITNPNYTATNGEPERLVGSGFAPYTYTAGGLITSGALKGTYFLGEGQTGQLDYGTYSSTSSPYMIGGDTDVTLAGHVGTNSLLPDESRISVFNRTSFDVTNSIEIFGQVSYNRYHGISYYQQTPSTGVSIKSDNAYLLTQYPEVAAAMAANNLSSITIGTSNAGFPVPGSNNTREVYRYVGGADGTFNALNRDWTFNAYFQHGITKSHEELINTWNTARMALAQDAVLYNGQIVCRSTITDPGNGCVPIDRLGTDGPSAEALAYIYGDAQPQRDQTIKQDVGAVSFNTQLFDMPAGPVAVAFGGEWRRESINGSVESQFNSGWLYGNYLVNKGSYNVKEGFVELSVPVFTGFDIDAAGRYTDYSTSGGVTTYKIGATWQPIPDIKLRGTYSHDIRAPNLQELFAAGTARTNTVILPDNAPLTGSQQFIENTVGNPNLKPEKANTWTAGVVVSPRFLPGFTASFDYYDIKITDAIGSVTSQNTVDNCYELGLADYCANIVYSGGALSTITIQPFNFASQREKGFDVAASYRTAMSAISEKIPGNFSISANLTHYISNVVDNGVFPIDYAGVNGGSLSGSYSSPSWVYRISAFYDIDPVTLNFVTRGFSDGVYGNDYIECTSNCPASTTQYRTINNNHINGAIYFDTSASVKLRSAGREATLSVVVNNLLNRAPELIGNGPSGNNVPAYAQTNRSLYDVIGRTYRLSISVSL
ncbi:TonB-dependent siderophore receptor [Novosphingobium sp. KA1]|uniref:TonB-dependent receptor plug domain-containing protein n=1 Tax=Novosphingobium sp. (strain KA1) TaxID=164608 RepID=UPI001A8D1324|nr:TonB-dependent receptor [Novosphingobium sp. KA1]QSR20227.1 TonB-dependent receptor [Novosphingobium sp. KA1]